MQLETGEWEASLASKSAADDFRVRLRDRVATAAAPTTTLLRVMRSEGKRAARSERRVGALLDALNVLLTAAALGRRGEKGGWPASTARCEQNASPARRTRQSGSSRRRRGGRARRFSTLAAESALVATTGRVEDSDSSEAAISHKQQQQQQQQSPALPPPKADCVEADEAASAQSSTSRTTYRRMRRGDTPKPRESREQRLQRRRHRRRRTPGARRPKKVKARVASFLEAEQIDGTGYRLVLRLGADRIMAHRRGHFEYWRRPRLEVRDNKTSEYRESYGGYCGRYPKLKSWLYYA